MTLGSLSGSETLQEWFTVYDHNRRPNCTVSDLIMGNEYQFRVYSENLCGLSEEPRLSKNTAAIPKIGVTVCDSTDYCNSLDIKSMKCLHFAPGNVRPFISLPRLFFFYRPGVQTKPPKGDRHGLCTQVYSAVGGQICCRRLQHCHQLCCERLSQGKHH